MQGMYTYIPETNHVPREYSVAAILSLLFMVATSLVPALALLNFTFRSMCEVLNMAVFCSSLNSWFPGMFLTYFLKDFEMVPIAPIITGITLVFTFHMRCIAIARPLYFKILSASILITILSPETATSNNIHVPFSLSRFIMSGLLLGMVLSICTYWFHSMVTLPPWLVYTDFGTCSYQCFCQLLLLLFVITFVWGIYYYTPERNNFSGIYLQVFCIYNLCNVIYVMSIPMLLLLLVLLLLPWPV